MTSEGNTMNTIIDLGQGRYGYQSVEPDYMRPIMRTWIWPLFNCQIEGICGNSLETAIGREATCRNSYVKCYLGNGSYFRATMPELAQAISITEIPIPPPPVPGGSCDTLTIAGRNTRLAKKVGSRHEMHFDTTRASTPTPLHKAVHITNFRRIIISEEHKEKTF